MGETRRRWAIARWPNGALVIEASEGGEFPIGEPRLVVLEEDCRERMAELERENARLQRERDDFKRAMESFERSLNEWQDLWFVEREARELSCGLEAKPGLSALPTQPIQGPGDTE